MILDYDYEVQTSATFVLYILVIAFVLCYWFDQKIAFGMNSIY